MASTRPRTGVDATTPTPTRNIAALTAAFASAGQPIVYVQHSSTDPHSPLHRDHPGHAFKDYLEEFNPNLIVTKSVNSSFHGTPDLHAWLQRERVTGLVVCGITTNHCCETTARVAGNLGYDTIFAFDATHTFDRTGPDGRTLTADALTHATCTNLHGEFATVMTTAAIVAKCLARRVGHHLPRAAPRVSAHQGAVYRLAMLDPGGSGATAARSEIVLRSALAPRSRPVVTYLHQMFLDAQHSAVFGIADSAMCLTAKHPSSSGPRLSCCWKPLSTVGVEMTRLGTTSPRKRWRWSPGVVLSRLRKLGAWSQAYRTRR